MGVGILDADHPAGAISDRLRETEQVGAGVVLRIAAIAVVFERMIDNLVEQFPPRPRFDRDDRDPQDCKHLAQLSRKTSDARRRFLGAFEDHGLERAGLA